MRTLLWSAAAVLVGLAIIVPVRADDDAKKVIEKAVKAHGGAENLAKYKDKGAITKGKMHITTMGLELDATMEMTVAHGKTRKFRQDIQLSVMGQDINQQVVYDGKEMWIAINGKVAMTIDKKEDLALLEEAAWSEEAAGLVLLNDKDVETSIIGESKVGDTPVIGIRVSKKGHKDVSLFFDKESGLLKKVQSRGLDFMSRAEVEQERIMDDYKETDGIKHPQKLTIIQDGKKLVEMEITETKYLDTVGDDVFAKPKD
jgi:hypothetical protein